MAFTKEYISLCLRFRSLFQKRRKIPGDWYGNVLTGEVKCHDGEPLGNFADPNWFYIPELDDLFAFLDNQVMLTQECVRPPESIVLSYKPATGWEVGVSLENRITFSAGNGKSPHEALLNVLYGMASFAVTRPDPDRNPDVSTIKQRYRELAWRMEMEGDPDLWDDSATVVRSGTHRVSQKDVDPVQKTGFLAVLREAVREVARLRRGKR